MFLKVPFTFGEPPMSTVCFPVLQADAVPAPQTLASKDSSGALEALGPAVIVTVGFICLALGQTSHY